MKKLSKVLVLLVAVASLFALVNFSVSADHVLEELVDTFELSNDGYAGPVFSDPLHAGSLYRVTVEGTFSIWHVNSWGQVCQGTPETAPLFPSTSTTNGPTGIDAAYVWAYPTASAFLCPGGTPAVAVPVRHLLFEVSTDGGTNWAGLAPVETEYNPAHVYHYEYVAVAGGEVLGFRLNDKPLSDNYGQIKIIVEEVNQPPVVDLGGPYHDFEGSPVTFDGSGTTDPEGDALTFAWSFGDGMTGTGVNPVHIYADNADFTVCLVVTDAAGNEATGCTVAYIANVAPAVGPITLDQTIVPIGTTINATSPFTDPGTDDTHTAIWTWGDGTSSPGVVSEISGSGDVDGSHTYSDAGEYVIKLTVTDDDGGVGSATTQVLVYDPRDFVTGGGWFWMPEGSCPSCGGGKIKLTFGLVAKYHKNLDLPTGSTEVQFHDGDINFHARDYEWLVIVGPKAIYEGVGTINGEGSYGFILSVIDGKLSNANGNKDLFRIKIWNNVTGDLVADTQMGDPDFADPTTPVQGSIVIHDR